MTELKGIVYKLGDDINTDVIISGRYKFSITDPDELARHIFEDIDPDFYNRFYGKHFFIVAGNNFGCGSSREQAPLAIKHAGCQAILAKSFARIFYRNAFNIGLPLIDCNTDSIKQEDIIMVDLDKGIIVSKTKNSTISIKPFNEFQKALIREGGIVNYYKKHGGLALKIKN